MKIHVSQGLVHLIWPTCSYLGAITSETNLIGTDDLITLRSQSFKKTNNYLLLCAEFTKVKTTSSPWYFKSTGKIIIIKPRDF